MTKLHVLAGRNPPALGTPTRRYTCQADLQCDLETREARFQRTHQVRMRAKYWKTMEKKRIELGSRERYDQWWSSEMARKRGSFAFVHAMVATGGALTFPMAPGKDKRRDEFVEAVRREGLAPPSL